MQAWSQSAVRPVERGWGALLGGEGFCLCSAYVCFLKQSYSFNRSYSRSSGFSETYSAQSLVGLGGPQVTWSGSAPAAGPRGTQPLSAPTPALSMAAVGPWPRADTGCEEPSGSFRQKRKVVLGWVLRPSSEGHFCGEVGLGQGGFTFLRKIHQYLVKQRNSCRVPAPVFMTARLGTLQGSDPTLCYAAGTLARGDGGGVDSGFHTPKWRGTWGYFSALGAFCRACVFRALGPLSWRP